jgi:hypothetical protein
MECVSAAHAALLGLLLFPEPAEKPEGVFLSSKTTSKTINNGDYPV